MSEVPFSPEQLLTPEECMVVDSTMMPYRDKFATRLAIYALRTLQPIAEQLKVSIADLHPDQIGDSVRHDRRLLPQEEGSSDFADWYISVLTASLVPLKRVAAELGVSIEDLTVPQIVGWFEKEVATRLSGQPG